MNKRIKNFVFPFLVILFSVHSIVALASGSETGNGSYHDFASSFLWIAVLILAAKISSVIEKAGQPSVLGELVIGVVIGNLFLLGVNIFEPIKSDNIIKFLSELGVVVLLFQIGLESNIAKMRQVGLRAFLVATIGVVAPFVLGAYLIGPLILPGLDHNAYLFLGAALTATSVGITARVFKDLNKLHTKEAQIVLGAAVIDDVMGLVILAVVSAMVTMGTVSLAGTGLIIGKAVLFLLGAIFLGSLLAPVLSNFFAKIHSGSGTKLGLALSFGLITAFLSQKIGLAPIVGAFAAGLVLDAVHFRNFKEPEICEEIQKTAEKIDHPAKEEIIKALDKHSEKHVENLIEPIAHFLVPIFFVFTGMGVDLRTLSNPNVVLTAIAITILAFAGKIISGAAAGKVKKMIVGFGMIPRGEVGLIFATMGRSLGVISDEVFSIVVIMVILSTLLTPPILARLLKKS